MKIQQKDDAATLRGAKMCIRDSYKAAMAGDTLAREVFRQTGTRIGKACAEIATFLSPEAFIFFGGLAQAGEDVYKRQSLSQSMLFDFFKPNALR